MEALIGESTEQNNGLENGKQTEPVLEEFAGRLLTENEAIRAEFEASEEGMGV